MCQHPNMVEKEGFLPGLPDGICGEQFVFQQKVFRANEAFNKANNDIINWFKFPSERRQYPKSRLKNKIPIQICEIFRWYREGYFKDIKRRINCYLYQYYNITKEKTKN